ncbi:hypothetical protein DFH06DRAFT_1238729 [Mycena polygramma]|nr:hypothetical protein DFH06DRAFT_1238729 [Mycena polygramma]
MRVLFYFSFCSVVRNALLSCLTGSVRTNIQASINTHISTNARTTLEERHPPQHRVSRPCHRCEEPQATLEVTLFDAIIEFGTI